MALWEVQPRVLPGLIPSPWCPAPCWPSISRRSLAEMRCKSEKQLCSSVLLLFWFSTSDIFSLELKFGLKKQVDGSKGC